MSPRLIAGGIALAVMFGAAAGLYWKGRLEGAARARPKIEAALAQAAVVTLEAQGAKASLKRVDTAVAQRDAARRTVSDLTVKSLAAEDARAPLERSRLDRLRAADLQLCEAAPALVGCAEGRDAG